MVHAEVFLLNLGFGTSQKINGLLVGRSLLARNEMTGMPIAGVEIESPLGASHPDLLSTLFGDTFGRATELVYGESAVNLPLRGKNLVVGGSAEHLGGPCLNVVDLFDTEILFQFTRALRLLKVMGGVVCHP